MTRLRVDLADVLDGQIRASGFPRPVREFVGVPGRKFRLDLAWPSRKLFAEVDGAEWVKGRHSTGAGMQTDCTKWCAMTLQGWRGYRFTGTQVQKGIAIAILEQEFMMAAGPETEASR